MVGAQPHGLVDRLHRAHALIERVDRLVDHRQQDAIDDEGGKILRDRDALAQAFDEAPGEAEGLVLGGDAADQLDQLHHRHRIHEMDADEALGPVGDGGEPRDGDRRGVGGEDGALLELRTKVDEDLALDGLVLGGGLDDEVGLADGRPDRRRSRMRFSAACISASVMMPRETWRAMLRSMVERALSIASFLTSLRRRRSRPAPPRGRCRCPSGPAPMMPTDLMAALASGLLPLRARSSDRRVSSS